MAERKAFCLQMVECCGDNGSEGGNGSNLEIVDNLDGNTDEDHGKALSAYQGSVLNQKIDEIDTKIDETNNKLGCTDQLWKNTNWTSFAGQTLTIPELEKYKMALISCISYSSGIESTTMIPLDSKNSLYQMINHSPAFVNRQVRVVNNTTLTFTNGATISSNGTTTDNTVQIPVRIYGIK